MHKWRWMWAGVVCLLALAECRGDVLIFKNGDRISGKVIKKDGNKITFKTEVMGDITAPWSAVASVSTDEPVTVALPNARQVTTAIQPAGDKIVVPGEGPVPLDQIAAIRNAEEQREWDRLRNPGIFDLWKGFADLGFALARGNARTNTLTSAVNANRVTRRAKTSLYFNQIYATARVEGVASASAEALRGGWSHNQNLADGFFVNLFNDYEYDRFQSLDLRFVAGTGAGYSPYRSERMRLDLVGGGAYNREKFFTFSRDSAEAYWGDDWTFALNQATSLRQSFRMFNNLSETGSYRVNFDFGTATTLRKWISWQVTASNRLLSNPVAGRKSNDVLVSTGFRVSFAK